MGNGDTGKNKKNKGENLMSDYYNGINKVEDKQVKLQDKVYDWWESLTEQRQWDIIEDHIGIENMNEETNPDEEYGNLSWDEQFEIYKDNNPREFRRGL